MATIFGALNIRDRDIVGDTRYQAAVYGIANEYLAATEAEANRLLEAIREPLDETEEDVEEEAEETKAPSLNGKHAAGEAVAPDAIIRPGPPIVRFEASFPLPNGADEDEAAEYVYEALIEWRKYLGETDPMALLDAGAVRVEIAR